ncbi:MAG TPA: tetratricopeptide repeat protein, partial [Candidatus Angelobacter sp.]|nr:tetratricopeptide repeat protein [Candidatus Angelobacter sp.]
EGWSARVDKALAHAIPVFEVAGHESGLATAWRMRYGIEAAALRFDAALEAADRVARHAEAAGDPRQEGRGAIAVAQAALNGPTPVREGIARCNDLVVRVDGDRRTTALVRLCLAQLLAMDEDVEGGRDQYRAARDMLLELGPGVLTSSTSTDAAAVELLAGDLDTAVDLLRRDERELEALGESYLRSTVLGLLGRVLALGGNLEEAERTASATRELAAEDDVDAQILWRQALALTRVRQGRSEEGIALLDEAVALATVTNDPMRTAQALGDRAVALATIGRPDEAHRDHERAGELYRSKGNLAALRQLDASPLTS